MLLLHRSWILVSNEFPNDLQISSLETQIQEWWRLWPLRVRTLMYPLWLEPKVLMFWKFVQIEVVMFGNRWGDWEENEGFTFWVLSKESWFKHWLWTRWVSSIEGWLEGERTEAWLSAEEEWGMLFGVWGVTVLDSSTKELFKQDWLVAWILTILVSSREWWHAVFTVLGSINSGYLNKKAFLYCLLNL